MTPTPHHNNYDALLADHGARLQSLEAAQRAEKDDRQRALEAQDEAHKALAEKVDGLKNWLMATLASALLGMLMQLLIHTSK